jgi:hypothetical protein
MADTAVGGSMELVCIPPTGLDIHLTGFPHNESLTLHLWATPVKALQKNKQLSITAVWCTAPDKCENGKGSVEFRHINITKNASGTYDLDFSNDHKEKGAFAVQRRQQKTPFVCQ